MDRRAFYESPESDDVKEYHALLDAQERAVRRRVERERPVRCRRCLVRETWHDDAVCAECNGRATVTNGREFRGNHGGGFRC